MRSEKCCAQINSWFIFISFPPQLNIFDSVPDVLGVLQLQRSPSLLIFQLHKETNITDRAERKSKIKHGSGNRNTCISESCFHTLGFSELFYTLHTLPPKWLLLCDCI